MTDRICTHWNVPCKNLFTEIEGAHQLISLPLRLVIFGPFFKMCTLNISKCTLSILLPHLNSKRFELSQMAFSKEGKNKNEKRVQEMKEPSLWTRSLHFATLSPSLPAVEGAFSLLRLFSFWILSLSSRSGLSEWSRFGGGRRKKEKEREDRGQDAAVKGIESGC